MASISNIVTNPLNQAIQSKINPTPISLNPLSYAKAPSPTPTPAPTQQLTMPNYSTATLNLAPSLGNMSTSGSTSPTAGLAKPIASAPQPTAQPSSGYVPPSTQQTVAPSRTAIQTGNGQTAYYDSTGQAWDSATGGNKVGNTAIATNTYQAPQAQAPAPQNQTYVPPNQTYAPPTPSPTTASATPPPQYSASNPPTFPGLVSTVANQGAAPTAADLAAKAQAEDAYNKYQQYVKDMATSQTNEANTIAGINSTPIPLEFQQGRGQVVQSQYAQQQAAIGQEEAGAASIYSPAISAAFTGQGQQFGAANNAASLAQPTQVPYSNQFVSPTTGQPVGGGAAGSLPQAAQDFVNSLSQQVQTGQMTRPDAESRLSAYGPAGLQALNSALGSGFNTNASNASAATTAVGQQIQTAIPPANQALDSLQTAYNNLSGFQQGATGFGNIPILSGLAQSLSINAGPGREAASAYQGALQEARSRIDAALVGSIGVNAAAAQANALLPDNMLPNEIPQKIAAAKQYLQNQLASYTQSGNQPLASQNATSGSSGGWASLGD